MTERRLPFLRRAVGCYRKQTHRQRELVLVYRDDDLETAAFVRSLAQNDRGIVPVRADGGREVTLGQLRNLGAEHANGEYLAVWDDDDWHAPQRLSEQLRALQAAHLPASALGRIAIYDDRTRVAYHSRWRAWEGTLVCSLAHLGRAPYADRARNEDTPVLRALERERAVVLLDRPDLYTYVFHSSNTCPDDHKRLVISEGSPMEAHWAAQIARRLGM